MSDAAPPPWVKRAPGLGAPHKFMLLVLWGWGPFMRRGPVEPDGERQPAGPVVVFPSRETLAAATGQPEGTVKNQLRRLASTGWIRRESGSAMTLAWRVPHAFEYGGRTTQGPRGSEVEPDHTRSCGVHPESTADHTCTPSRTTGAPLSSSELPIELPMNLGDAPATPQSSVNGAPVGEAPEEKNHDRRDANRRVGAVRLPADPDPRLPVARSDHSQPSLSAAANPHLGSKLEAHRAIIAQRDAKPANRVELTPAVHAAVVAARMSSQLEGATWVKCMLETLDDCRIPEAEHAAKVTLVLSALHEQPPSNTPPKSQVWYRRHRDWQREAMGLGQVKRSGGMSGGIVAARPMPDWDAQAAERRAST